MTAMVGAAKQYLVVYRTSAGTHVFDTVYSIAQRNFAMQRCRSEHPGVQPFSLPGETPHSRFKAPPA